jgi:hypothetical protein
MKWTRITGSERNSFYMDVIHRRILLTTEFFTMGENVRIVRYRESEGVRFRYSRYIAYNDYIINRVFRNETLMDKISSTFVKVLNFIFNKEIDILDFENSSKFDKYCDRFDLVGYFKFKIRDKKLKELGL